MKKFFLNTEGKWVIDNGEHYRELLPGDYEPLYTGTKVSIVNLNNNKLELMLMEVTDIGKSEFTEDTYVDLGEFKTATKNFFTTAAINEIPTDAQNPVTIDDDSIFVKDIDFDNSDFTGWVGDPTELFKSPFSSSLINSSGDNPKVLIIAFNRTVKGLQMGLGENNGGNFSNVKVSLLGSGGLERSLFDNSSDNTKRTSQRVLFEDEYYNSLKIEFFTDDAVSLSNLIISKGKDIAISSTPISPVFQTTSPFVYPDDIYTAIGENWTNDILNVFRYAEGVDIVNSSGDNPKSLLFTFKGAVASNTLGLISTDGTFSNAKVTLFQGTLPKVIYDESIDNTLRNNLILPISDIVAFNAVLVEFFTANTITLGAISIGKNILADTVIRGENPSGEFRNVRTNFVGNLLVSLDEQKDAFGRLKIAEPFTIFDNSLTTELSNTLFWSELINGAASSAYDGLNSNMDMNVVADGDYVVRQTKQRFKYQPGKSHEFFITGLWSTETGIRKRAGLLDYDNIGLATVTNVPQNGVFFENNSGILSWNIAKNGVITETVTQDNWNIDKLDGFGRSGFNLDVSAVNILTCQLEWLGVGVVLVGFATGGGEVAYCHAFKHASQSGFTETYMRTANLPVSYELTSITGGGAMKQICCSVISGGGFNPLGQTSAVQNNSSVSVLNNATELLVGIRLREDSFEYTIDPGSLSILSENNGNTLWALCINPTYDGTVTWADVDDTEVQQALNNDNQVIDFGIILARGSFSNNANSINQEIKSSVKIGKDLNGNRDELWLVVTALGNESYYGTINFKELI